MEAAGRALALALLLGAVLSGCCCRSEAPRYYTVLYSDVADAPPSAGFEWRRDYERISSITFWFPATGVPLRDVPLLELYTSTGDRVPLTETVLRGVGSSGEECPRDEVTYVLPTLDVGHYVLVHRMASAPEGFVRYRSWGTFRGEPALTATIGASVVDGGLRDAE